MHHFMRTAVVVSAMLLPTGMAWAGERTVTLAVENMTCATCPITVKKSLVQVSGVSKADVSLEKEAATVTFDDAKATVADLIQATTNAGYPSRQKSP